MKTHILIVDDDRAIGKMVGFFLDASGYQTTVLDDPRTVSTFLKGQHSDLVLLDVMLPYIDGFTLCETFRDKDPDIPVIFLTVGVWGTVVMLPIAQRAEPNQRQIGRVSAWCGRLHHQTL